MIRWGLYTPQRFMMWRIEGMQSFAKVCRPLSE